MNMLRIMILCMASALVCASLRIVHPQIASAVALAAGIAALMLSAQEIRILTETLGRLEAQTNAGAGSQIHLLKLCGIALIAEFASDICRDAGEVSLAHRIDVGVKIGIVAMALPTASRIMERISQLIR